MGRTLTNPFSLIYAEESVLGLLPGESGQPGTPTWKQTEPNSVGAFGADLTTVARRPISKNRQRRKGTTVDLASGPEYEGDATMEALRDFAKGFMLANYLYPYSGATTRQAPLKSGALFNNLAADNDPPPAGTDSGYNHDAITTAMTAGRLIYVRGFSNAINNGLKVVKTGSTTTATLIETDVLIDETPGNTANASLELCGVRGGTGDIQVNASGHLTSTVLDFTTLGLSVGQVIHVGGDLTANRFAVAANFGFARIKAIAANLLTLDKRATTFTTDNGSGKQIYLFFGPWLRNVAVDAADYKETTYQFEGAYANLQNPGPGDMYEYAKGNYANEMSFSLPIANKATVGFKFVGTDTDIPTVTRKTNAATPAQPVMTSPFNTTSDIFRLRVTETDETGLTTDFKAATVTLKNNATPEKVLGVLGAKYINVGIFEVDIESTVVFTNANVISAIRQNRTVTMDFALRNADGAVFVDLPSVTLGGGKRDFPLDQSITATFKAQPFGDTVLGYTASISIFPYAPAA